MLPSDEEENQVQSVIVSDSSDEKCTRSALIRISPRKRSTTKKYKDYVLSNTNKKTVRSRRNDERITVHLPDTDVDDEVEDDKEEHSEHTDDAATSSKSRVGDVEMLDEDNDVAGRCMFGFNTPKKRDGMAQLAALNTPKTPKTPQRRERQTKTPDTKSRRKSATVTVNEPKTPSHIRKHVKNQIAKLVDADKSGSDFSADDSDFVPSNNSDTTTSDSDNDSGSSDAVDDEPKTPHRKRRPIIVPVLPKTPSAARLRQRTARSKQSTEYVPESDSYFQSHSHNSGKILTSDHTLDRLKQPRLPADRLFTLLSQMKLSTEHESAMNAIMEEYRSYFAKWMYILNEGYNLLLYGLGSKRPLLQAFHRHVLSEQTVLVINGFFPSLTLKDVLDSVISEILDAGLSPANPHEAVDMIAEEFALIPDTHMYMIVHNLDGIMLRNAKAQSIMARLANVPNIHLLASIDHINTPLLWDHTKLSYYNFSWWDCTTMLPYTDETAYENSLLVQNSGELALSSMRSVFSSLTANSRGIYMLIVKYQLQNKPNNPNYQGMSFKDLYWSCREAFLVSSDLALRAQLTEFLDHKLVKSKRNVDGSEQLTIPIEAALLQQFLDEQEKSEKKL